MTFLLYIKTQQFGFDGAPSLDFAAGNTSKFPSKPEDQKKTSFQLSITDNCASTTLIELSLIQLFKTVQILAESVCLFVCLSVCVSALFIAPPTRQSECLLGTTNHDRISQFTMLCKGDMSQQSKTAFTQLSLAPSKSIYNEILF